MKQKLIIDCDPGIEDAFPVAMAVASEAFEIVAVSTTYGNVGLDKTTNDALRILEWLVRGHQSTWGRGTTAPC